PVRAALRGDALWRSGVAAPGGGAQFTPGSTAPGTAPPWQPALSLDARAGVGLTAWSPATARTDLGEAGRLLQTGGMDNPGLLAWRTHLAGLEPPDADLGALVAGELALARQFGADRPIGIALHARGLLAG